MSKGLQEASAAQQKRNTALLDSARYLRPRVESRVLPLHIDIDATDRLTEEQVELLDALQIEAATTAIRALGSLAEINEVDHLGGGLELIPSLLLTLAVTDYEEVQFTIEHAHTSVGYFSCLAALGFIDGDSVVQEFRRSLDIPGHVSWLPGGTQLNGGRLGVMVPVSVGQALGLRARHQDRAWVITHCGDAGWISGQALNGYNAADIHRAPVTFVMHRNGIQLSGPTDSIMDRDPRGPIAALGIELLEIPSLHDTESLFEAYGQARKLAAAGRANMIYPVGYKSLPKERIDLAAFGRMYGVTPQVEAMAAANGVSMDQEIWIPGSLMSFRDTSAMLECLFAVNKLPGGKTHHDGHMKGREVNEVLSGPMFSRTRAQQEALATARAALPRQVVTTERLAPGTDNLVVSREGRQQAELPGTGAKESARSGSEAGYALVASEFPEKMFVVSCDLDASTKLAKARDLLAPGHRFEMSIEEQAAALLTNGLAMSGPGPQLNVVSTFAAFFEGIAREGFDMWRYQRNLNGINEGLNVTFHISHVGACTGRDHFSGWGLDWINIGLTYLPYLHRFYAPADARSAFLSVCDLAAHYGGHIIGIPRDSLPILEAQDGTRPLFAADMEWEGVTHYRRYTGARKVILAFGAPAFLAGQAAAELASAAEPVDVFIVNALPLPKGALDDLLSRYPDGAVTVEDGLIGDQDTGVRGFAGVVAAAACPLGVPVVHIGITDPRIAPADGHMQTWAHFGITTEALTAAAESL